MPKKPSRKRFRPPKPYTFKKNKENIPLLVKLPDADPFLINSSTLSYKSAVFNHENESPQVGPETPTAYSSCSFKQPLTPRKIQANTGHNKVDTSPCLAEAPVSHSSEEKLPVCNPINTRECTEVVSMDVTSEEDSAISTLTTDRSQPDVIVLAAHPLPATQSADVMSMVIILEEELAVNDAGVEELVVVSEPNPVVMSSTPKIVPTRSPNVAADSPTEVNLVEFWKQVETSIKPSLSPHWHTKVDSDGLHLILMSCGVQKVVQRSLCVKPGGEVSLVVHGKIVPEDHDFWKRNLQLIASANEVSPEEMSSLILIVYKAARDWRVCYGVMDETLWVKDYPNCFLEEGYQNYKFNKTLRANQCHYLITPPHQRCSNCKKLVQVLQTRRCRKGKQKKGTPNKFKPTTACNSMEKVARVVKLSRANNNLNRRVTRLLARAIIAVERDGVELDDSLTSDLTKCVDVDNFNTFQKLLFESQQKSGSLKNKKSMKWHPAMIRFALNIKLISSAAYGVLRRYITLPSERTLYDYSHAFQVKEGIVDKFVGHVAAKINQSDPYSKQYMLSFDEIYISQNLVYNKETGALVGYCKLSEAEKEIREMESLLKDDSKPYDPTPPIAKTMLCFMVRAIFSDVKEVVAAYGVSTLCPDFLFKRHWDVVGHLESSGLEIVGCVSDGAPSNRTFIGMHKPLTVVPSGTVFDTCNIYAWPRRAYYFFGDVPHLLKTIRNNLATKARTLTKNGKEMKWQSFMTLYHASKKKTWRKSWKIDAPAIFLNSYSRMKVAYAAKILSKTVANELKERDPEGDSELIIFIEKVNDWFDMLNGLYVGQSTKKDNENLAPYTCSSDKRLSLLEDFLEYLFSWKAEVQNLNTPGLTGKKKEKLFLSHQTITGIEMAVRSFVAIIKMLLPEEEQQGETVRFIMARVFNQDKLEQYFGKQRARNGGSTNPNESEFFRNMNALSMVGQISGAMKRGNTQEELEAVPIDATPLPKRSVARRKLPV